MGGNGDEGTWTTVVSRRARRLERARLDGTTSGATRKAAAARAAATRRMAAAIIEHFGKGDDSGPAGEAWVGEDAGDG